MRLTELEREIINNPPTRVDYYSHPYRDSDIRGYSLVRQIAFFSLVQRGYFSIVAIPGTEDGKVVRTDKQVQD